MIYSFTVENFLSIRDRQTISFASTSDKTNRDLLTVEVKPNVYVNKLGLFYGANASGKSNILFALEAVFGLLYIPLLKKDLSVVKYSPFALCDGKPTYFEVVFFKDGIQYDYKISYCRTHIISENLMYYPSRNKALFYKRTFKNHDTQPDIEFGNSVKLNARSKQSIKENTFNNHTVLSTFGKISLNEDASNLADLYNWIKTKVHNLNGDNAYHSMIYRFGQVCQDNARKRFYINLLNKADFNITNFSIVDNREGLSPEIIEQIKVAKDLPEESKYHMLHDVLFTNHSETGDFDILLGNQSDGTRRFVELLDYLYDMVTDNHIYFFDELGNRMHHDLIVYYLLLFLHNSDQSQLFFSTHSIMLLDEDFVRRDMVYLADKCKETASSSYTRVSDMGLHKNVSLYKAYKIGKLGANPDIGSSYLNINESEDC